MRHALVAALALGGCTMDLTPKSANAPPAPCEADAVASYAGQPADRAEQARVAAGAALVRVIRPGDMVTRDYRIERLNVEVDGSGTITRLYCG